MKFDVVRLNLLVTFVGVQDRALKLCPGTSKWAKMGIPREDLDGKLFKDTYSSYFFTGTLEYHLQRRG